MPGSRVTDRLVAASVTWLLVLTWGAGVLVAVFYVAWLGGEQGAVRWWVVIIAVGAVVGTGIPVRRWVGQAVDAALFAHPEDARELIAEVGHSVQSAPFGTTDPQAVTREIAAQISRRLRLPYVAIVTGSEPVPPQADGTPPAPDRLVTVPLAFSGEPVGTLAVLPRPRDRALSAEDRALLGELATHIGIALHAALTTADLQASRTAVITAREEERRRIRRDLHDGLGPTLASFRLQLAAVQQLVPSQPERALELVDGLRSQSRDISALVRSLVYDLRPSPLDDVGLVAALQARAAEAEGLQVTVASVPAAPVLPAAVEVALYRIATEALANVLRHAHATTCAIDLRTADGEVELRVFDDGRGMPQPLIAGVGLAGMRERAEELGGRLQVLAGSPGTVVSATIPLAAAR